MAGSMFLKFHGPDVDGGATSKGHETWINILAWSQSGVMPTSPRRHHAGGATFENFSMSNFTFTKEMDSATDDLLKNLWSGKAFEKVEFVCYRTVGDTGTNQNAVPYLKIEMTDAVLADWSVSGADGSGLPIENWSLNVASVQYTYTKTNHKTQKAEAAQPVKIDLTTSQVS